MQEFQGKRGIFKSYLVNHDYNELLSYFEKNYINSQKVSLSLFNRLDSMININTVVEANFNDVKIAFIGGQI